MQLVPSSSIHEECVTIIGNVYTNKMRACNTDRFNTRGNVN